jgi:4'-phosphopantetheinyl transferase
MRKVHTGQTGARDRVDIWRMSLARAMSNSYGESSLSSDELVRAGRFHFERDRIRFVRCRTALRSLLGRYLGIRAPDIRLEYHSNGKPEVAMEQNKLKLQFNVSHSADEALIAIASHHRVGIDIEKIRNDIDIFVLAEHFFSTRERASLKALPENLQREAFFACWTRKEAFVKATGDGLSFKLADFSVSTHPRLYPKIEEIRGNRAAAQSWFLADLHCENSYRATLAVRNLPLMGNILGEIRQFEFEP